MNNQINLIYSRVSSNQQTFDAQEFACKEFCQKNNMVVNSMVREIGSARYGFNDLPKLQNVIFNMGVPFNLVVWSIDRLTRNYDDCETLYNIFVRNKISVFSVSDNIQLESYDFWKSRVKQAHYESDEISERVIRSVKYRRFIGDHIGNPAYGYKIVYVPTKKDSDYFQYKQVHDQENSTFFYEAGKTISNIINSTPQKPNVLPVINDKTHYNKRVLMLDIKEQMVIEFIKSTYEKKLNETEFNMKIQKLLEYNELEWFPIVFYKEFEDNDPSYTERGYADKSYSFVYVLSNDWQYINKKLLIKKSQKIVIQDYHIAAVLNDYQFTKRGQQWTSNLVRSIANNGQVI